MKSGNRVLNNIFSNWANLFVNIVISFFLAPFVVHSLGNTYYGVWVVMMQFTGYLYLLDLGVRESIIRYVSKYRAIGDSTRLNDILSAGLVFYSGIGFVAVLFSLMLAGSFSLIFNVPDDAVATARVVVILAGITIGQTLAFNVFTGILMGVQRYDIFNKIGIALAFVRLALILIFLNLGFGIVALASIQLFVGLVTNLLIFRSSVRILNTDEYRFQYNKRPIRDQFPIFKTLYNYSVHVVVNNIGQKAIFYTDALVIGIFLSASAVTFYAIAGNLIEYLRRLILISNTVLNPLVSEMEAVDDVDSIRNVLLQGGRLSVLLALPISIVYLIMGREFIGMWMGAEYAVSSADVLVILTSCVLLACPHMTISSVLYGMSRHDIIARLRTMEAAANLLLSIVLVQTVGIVGVALGTAIPHVLFMGIALPLFVRRILDYSFFEYVLNIYVRPMLASIPFVTTCLAIKTLYPSTGLLDFMIKVALAMPVYFVSIWVLCLTSKERAQYRHHFRRIMGAGEAT